MGAPVTHRFARQATLRNASAPPLLLADPQELALPKNSDVGVGLLRQGCRTISFKEEVMANMDTCSCGTKPGRSSRLLCAARRAGPSLSRRTCRSRRSNRIVTLELEEVSKSKARESPNTVFA